MQLDVIKESGMYQKDELEKLLGVSRMSIYKYFIGRTEPRPALRRRIDRLATIITAFTNKGILPFTEDADGSTRQTVIEKMQEILNK